MLLQSEVLVTVSGSNKSYYEALGYSLPYTRDRRGRVGVKKGSKILVKIEDIKKKSNIPIIYRCDVCGSLHSVKAFTVFGRENSQFNKNGHTYCYRCSNKNRSGVNNPRYKHGNNRFCEYRNNAKKRKIDFSLTVEQFADLTGQECHYCGGYSSEWEAKSRGNGIDRKDSSRGYFEGNCVPCCSKCNFVKNSMPYDAFVKYVTRIYERVKSY